MISVEELKVLSEARKIFLKEIKLLINEVKDKPDTKTCEPYTALAELNTLVCKLLPYQLDLERNDNSVSNQKVFFGNYMYRSTISVVPAPNIKIARDYLVSKHTIAKEFFDTYNVSGPTFTISSYVYNAVKTIVETELTDSTVRLQELEQADISTIINLQELVASLKDLKGVFDTATTKELEGNIYG